MAAAAALLAAQKHPAPQRKQKHPHGTSFKNMDLRDYDFSLQKLEDIDFSGSNLSHVDFRGSYLNNVNFKGANLEGALFNDWYRSSHDPRGTEIHLSKFDNANMSEANLDATYIVASSFLEVNFTETRFCYSIDVLNHFFSTGTKFINCNLNFSDFKGCFFFATRISGCTLFNGTFHNTKWERAVVKDSNFNFADFIGANFKDGVFEDLVCADCNFKNTSFYKSKWKGVEFSGSDFEDAYVSQMIFKDVYLDDTKGLEAYVGKELKKPRGALWETLFGPDMNYTLLHEYANQVALASKPDY